MLGMLFLGSGRLGGQEPSPTAEQPGDSRKEL